MSKPMRFAIFEGKRSEYYWKLISGSGAVLLTSEGYKTRRARDSMVTKAAQETGLSIVEQHDIVSKSGKVSHRYFPVHSTQRK